MVLARRGDMMEENPGEAAAATNVREDEGL